MIGILAGMGPRSTAPFVDRMIDLCQSKYNAVLDDEFPPMMIHSCPTPYRIKGDLDDSAMIQSILSGIKKT